MLGSTFRTFRTAARSLRRNVMRSALTTLGIIIGVGAVIAMSEIGNGSRDAIAKSITSMGANTLLVFPGNSQAGGISQGWGSGTTLTPKDCDAIINDCPAIEAASPIVRTGSQLTYGDKNYQPSSGIQGVATAFFTIRNWDVMAEGDTFTDHDVLSSTCVCVVGQTVKRELFGNRSPVGLIMRINGISFRVLGVLSPKGANMMGQDQDDTVLAPWTTIKYRVNGAGSSSSAAASSSISTAVNTASQLFPGTTTLYPTADATEQADTPQPVKFANIQQIIVGVVTADQVPQAIDQITALLEDRHHINLAKGQPDDFTIRNMSEINTALTSTSDNMTNLLMGVALISLIVGGVGIMNIMLVSVTERTREIGLRMAVGARGGDILRQFLIEAMVLCLIGGVLGIIVGRGSSWLITYFKHWPTVISIPAIVAAVLVSATTGIIFGYYPAWKASRLDPIEALRYE